MTCGLDSQCGVHSVLCEAVVRPPETATMEDPAASVSKWIEQARRGDEAAAQALWDRYFHRLMALARNKLAGSPTRAENEEDVALSALHSFFRGISRGRYPKLRDRDSLWPLLAKITECKALNLREKMLAQKRGRGDVRGESVFDNSDSAGGIQNFAVSAPTEEFAESLSLQCRELMDRLRGDESLVQVARLKLEGYTNAEIAQKIGCVPRTVERKLNLIRELWTDAGGLK